MMEQKKLKTEAMPYDLDDTPIMKKFKEDGDIMLADVQAMEVNNNADAQALTDWAKGVKELGKQIDGFISPWVKRAYQFHKDYVAMKKATMKPLEDAEAIAKKMLKDFNDKEAKRIADELKAKEDAERLKLAELAEASGDDDLAEDIVAGVVPVVVEPVQETKIAGASFIPVWGYEVVNEQIVPREWLMIDDKKVKSYIKNTKGLGKIEGILAVKDTSVRL